MLRPPAAHNEVVGCLNRSTAISPGIASDVIRAPAYHTRPGWFGHAYEGACFSLLTSMTAGAAS